jgi:hypothetical protein
MSVLDSIRSGLQSSGSAVTVKPEVEKLLNLFGGKDKKDKKDGKDKEDTAGIIIQRLKSDDVELDENSERTLLDPIKSMMEERHEMHEEAKEAELIKDAIQEGLIKRKVNLEKPPRRGGMILDGF